MPSRSENSKVKFIKDCTHIGSVLSKHSVVNAKRI